MKRESMISGTTEELRKMPSGGETDWERLRAITDDELETAIRNDPDADFPVDAIMEENVRIVDARRSKQVSMRRR